MQQQTQISLDFSEIFSTNQPQPNRTHIQTVEKQWISQSFQVSNPKQQREQVTNQSLNSIIEAKPSRNPLVFKKLVSSASEQICNINRLIYSSCCVKRINRPTYQNVQQITKRLTAVNSCKRMKCISSSGSKQQVQNWNQLNIKKYQQLIKSKSLGTFHQLKALNGTNVFDRLHYNSKIKTAKLQNLQNQSKKQKIYQNTQQNKKSRIISNSQRYLKNYVPFYKRLEDEISHSFEKAEIIKKNPNIISKNQHLSFQPKLYPSPYKKLITSRYMNTANKQYCTRDFANFLNTSGNTQSSINRSSEIVDRIEQHFYNKMRLIFITQASKEVKVTHQSISLLSQVQFSILHGFIIYIQENSIRASDFDYLIRSYFHSLSTSQKIQLRSHQTQSRFKYTQLDQKRKLKLMMSRKDVKKQANINKGLLGTANRSKILGNYHLAIQHYI